MKTKISCLVGFLTAVLCMSASAQNIPVCEDPLVAGAYKRCTNINQNYLPVIPYTKGGTGATSAGDDTVLFGVGGGMPGFRRLNKTAVPGMSVDLSTSPTPLIEVRKDVGTGPQLIARFPGEGSAFNRWYVGQRGMLMTFNCSTGDGVTCIKDSTALNSVVFEMNSNSILRWSMESSTGISTWRTDAAQRSTEWRGAYPVWATELGSDGRITAIAGGTVRGARIGDTVSFPVQWPARLKRVPTKFSIGTLKVIGTSGSTTVTNADEAGAVLNVDVTNPAAGGDFTWIGQVHASN